MPAAFACVTFWLRCYPAQSNLQPCDFAAAPRRLGNGKAFETIKDHIQAPDFNDPARSTERESSMSERIETLKKARERMTDDRDAFAKTLAAPFDRDKAERARLKFIETQVLIDAIDRAIAGEQARTVAA
jgi:hypothetical protein